MPSLVGGLFGERLGRLINRITTVDNGAGEPWGIVNRTTVGKTMASDTAITAEGMIDLAYSVDVA
ncbi:MAG TPA: phage major capsid protein [Planctomicrobium sp.]|nr:phage major capsid protein [Planctomicrobium sp.]